MRDRAHDSAGAQQLDRSRQSVLQGHRHARPGVERAAKKAAQTHRLPSRSRHRINFRRRYKRQHAP